MDDSKKITLVLALSVVVALSASAYRYLYMKDYSFTIEAPCDAESEACYIRDCSEQDACPPNGFESYKVYEISAPDFDKCSDASCSSECSTRAVACVPVLCEEEGSCSDPVLKDEQQ